VTTKPSDLLGAYLDSLQTQRKLSAHTVVNYGRDLTELLELMKQADSVQASSATEPDFSAVTHFQIRKFAAQLHSRGLGPRSIARKLSAWRGFFEWLSEQMPLKSNPVDGVKSPKKSKPLPKALAADDAIHLVSQANPVKDAAAPMQRCNRAMFELLYSSGLRVSELTSLDVRYVQEAGYHSASWIDLSSGEAFVTGKGNKMRSIPIGAPAREAIANWLAVRETLIKTESPEQPALFLTERGTRMSPRVAQLRLKAHGQAVGMASDVHPHMLRHSFASHVLQSSGDLRAVQEMLGHASITATQVYTALDFQRLTQVYDAAHPRAKKSPSK
jgi:integrase/recombinase XerC